MSPKKGKARFPTEKLNVWAARMRRLFSCGRSGGASCAHSPRGNLSKNGRVPGDWWRRAACEEKMLMAHTNRYACRLLCLLVILVAQPCSVLAETPEQLISAAKNEK